MKKILALILCAVMALSFAACSAGGGTGTESEKSTDTSDVPAKVDGSVPVIKAGDSEVTFAEFNMYFRYLPLSLAANYNYYFGDQYKEQLLAREGLDIDAPLKDQDCPYVDGTFFDYFFEIAKNRLTEIVALNKYATDNGIELDASDREEIDGRVSTVAQNANPGKYEDDYYTKDVRHILFRFDYYDTEEACLAEAEKILEEYKTDPTEEHFAKLANKYSDDGTKRNEDGTRTEKTDGGVYRNVPLGQMVEPFDDWIYDEARVPGDTGIVKTTFGYHIMYFIGDGEFNDDGTAAVKSALTQRALDEYKETLGITFDDVFVEANID